MKKLAGLAAMVLFGLLATQAQASMSYECSRYVDGKPTGGHVKVTAASRAEAERIALNRYRNELKMRTDSVNCR